MIRSVQDFAELAYEPSTTRARNSAVLAFARFCILSKRPLAPTTVETFCEYATYLANSGVKVGSIRTYLSAIRTWFKLNDVADPTIDSFLLKTVLKGIKKAQAYLPNSKNPLTPVELLKIRVGLDWSSSRDRTLWAALVIGFWSFLRGSNLVPRSAAKFHADRHLSAENMKISDGQLFFSIKKTKTVQFNERVLVIPLMPVADSDLCPLAALLAMWELCPLSNVGPLFVFASNTGARSPLLHAKFNECT